MKLLVKMSNDTVKNAHIMLLIVELLFISYVEQKKKEKFKL